MDQPLHSLNDLQRHLQRDLQQLSDDAEALLRHAADDAGAGYNEARTHLERSLKSARERLQALGATSAAHVRDSAHAADAFVHRNPWPTIGVSACLGLAIGLLIGRK